jgi:tripartite-type tricarboxylate transporter receptor subunit TctC
MIRQSDILGAMVVLVAACTPHGVREATPTSVVANYPTKPVHLIEPFGAGGGPDVVARAISPTLAALWGQPVIVENHPGAGSTAAPALVAKASPDGYTLLVNTSAQAYSAALFRNLPYNPLEDFIPVAALTSQSYVLVAGRHAGFSTMAGLIAAAKVAPDKLRFASTGVGTGTHLSVEKLNLDAGIRTVHLPPRPGEGITDVIANTVAGRADYQMVPIPLALNDIRAGRLIPLGVSGRRRSPLLPDVPTVAEAGVSGFDFPIWYGVWAPAATPPELIDKLARDIARALATQGLRDTLATHGADPMTMTQPEFVRFVRRESEAAGLLSKAAGITPR